MAMTEFATGDASTVKLWSKLTMRDMLKKTYIKKFLGTGKSAILQKLPDLEKTAGDQIKFDLLMQMSGTGIDGDNEMTDNEEALVYYQDSVLIDQKRNAHKFARMSQQRTLHNMRTDGRDNLSDWFANWIDDQMFRYLGGDTSAGWGNVAVGTAPDTNHYIVTGDVTHTGVIATDETTAGSNDQLALSDLDYAKEKAQTRSPHVRPVMIDGGEYYVVVLHPYSATDLRLNVIGSTLTTWQEIQQYANSRGLKNPLFTNSLGVYNGMILYESQRIYSPQSNIRRNLLLGAQAGVFALGNAYGSVDQRRVGKNNLMSWNEESKDYGNRKGISVGIIAGMKKCTFNSADFGTMVITSYSALHN